MHSVFSVGTFDGELDQNDEYKYERTTKNVTVPTSHLPPRLCVRADERTTRATNGNKEMAASAETTSVRRCVSCGLVEWEPVRESALCRRKGIKRTEKRNQSRSEIARKCTDTALTIFWWVNWSP